MISPKKHMVATSTSSGVKLNASLSTAIRNAKVKSANVRWLVVKVEKEELVVESTGKREGAWTKDMDLIATSVLKPKKPCYVVLVKDDASVMLLSFVPDDAMVSDKMIYASSRGVLKNALGTGTEEYFGTAISDFKYAAYKKSSSIEAPLTEFEKIKKEEEANRGETEKYIANQYKSGQKSWLAQVTTGGKAPAPVALPGLAKEGSAPPKGAVDAEAPKPAVPTSSGTAKPKWQPKPKEAPKETSVPAPSKEAVESAPAAASAPAKATGGFVKNRLNGMNAGKTEVKAEPKASPVIASVPATVPAPTPVPEIPALAPAAEAPLSPPVATITIEAPKSVINTTAPDIPAPSASTDSSTVEVESKNEDASATVIAASAGTNDETWETS